jgi:hypothetical protein
MADFANEWDNGGDGTLPGVEAAAIRQTRSSGLSGFWSIVLVYFYLPGRMDRGREGERVSGVRKTIHRPSHAIHRPRCEPNKRQIDLSSVIMPNIQPYPPLPSYACDAMPLRRCAATVRHHRRKFDPFLSNEAIDHANQRWEYSCHSGTAQAVVRLQLGHTPPQR